MKESLVEVSPSMLMRLNERAAAWATRCCSASRETAASVATNPSMVAMSGRIMPAPLAIPVTVTPRLSSRARCDRALGTVSVVMIVSAARAQLSSHRSATHAGRPATMRSSGSGSMITPVENGSTCRESQPSSRAASPQLAFARASPSFPVPALAFPVLTMNARRDLPEARCSFATCTGAAQKRFCVNTPATRVPSARVMRSRSLRPAFLIPASATPSFTPLTGRRSSGFGGLRLTAMPPLTQLPVTMLVFLSRPAGTRIVAADLAHLPHERRRLRRGRRIGAGPGKRLFVSGVLILHVFDSRGLDLFRLLDLVPSLQLDRHQRARDFELDRLHEIAEQLERFALVFLLRVLLRVTAQVDPLAQVVERREVFAPVIVERRQEHEALELVHGVDRCASHLAAIGVVGSVDGALEESTVVEARVVLEPLRQRQLELELGGIGLFEARHIPLLFHAFFRNVRAEYVGHYALAQGRDLVRDVLRLENGVSQPVDLAPLVVGDVVVLEQLLADVEVVRFDLALRALDRAGDQAVLDRLAFGHPQALHDGVDPVACEDPQQRVFEREVKTRGARVALPARTAAQLVVDAPGLVPLGADDVQPSGGDDLVVPDLPLLAQVDDAALFLRRVEILHIAHDVDLLLDVSAQHDVGASAGHVGRDGDHLRAPGLRDDLGLARVLLRVQDLVRELVLLQHPGKQLRVLYRGRADHDFEPVDFLEFVGLGVGRAGHARELAVHAEVVLEGDRGERLVLALDLDVFLRLDRLVQ